MITELLHTSQYCYRHKLNRLGGLFEKLMMVTCSAHISGKADIAKNVSFSHGLMIIFLTKLHLLNFIKSGGVIVTITAGAMLIIGYSQTISSMIRTLLPFLAGTTWGGMIIGLLTMAVSYPLILLAMRYFPAILGYRK